MEQFEGLHFRTVFGKDTASIWAGTAATLTGFTCLLSPPGKLRDSILNYSANLFTHFLSISLPIKPTIHCLRLPECVLLSEVCFHVTITRETVPRFERDATNWITECVLLSEVCFHVTITRETVPRFERDATNWIKKVYLTFNYRENQAPILFRDHMTVNSTEVRFAEPGQVKAAWQWQR
jgi:hypothetical protein